MEHDQFERWKTEILSQEYARYTEYNSLFELIASCNSAGVII